MYNTKFILTDGTYTKDIYPAYLDKNERQLLRNKYKDKKHFLRCGCKPDANLFYRISEDLRIYPEKINYEHDSNCCRAQTTIKPPYQVDEQGNVMVLTSFDPKNFSRIVKRNNEDTNENVNEDTNEILLEPEAQEKITEEKNPQLSFKDLCRCINVDCFTNNILNNKQINDRQSFSISVYHRMKNVKLVRTKKAIGDMTLSKDGVQFIYSNFIGIQKKEYSTFIQTKTYGTDKIFNNLTYNEIAEKAINDFRKQYGIEPNQDTMIAAFQYLKKNKTTGNPYRILGRIHLFQVSNTGIYCRTLTEYNVFNALYRICLNNNNIRFWIPPEDDSIGAIIEIKGVAKKILLSFKNKKSGNIKYNDDYVPFIVSSSTIITEKILRDLIQNKQ